MSSLPCHSDGVLGKGSMQCLSEFVANPQTSRRPHACTRQSSTAGEPMVGRAGMTHLWVLIEHPGPWPASAPDDILPSRSPKNLRSAGPYPCRGDPADPQPPSPHPDVRTRLDGRHTPMDAGRGGRPIRGPVGTAVRIDVHRSGTRLRPLPHGTALRSLHTWKERCVLRGTRPPGRVCAERGTDRRCVGVQPHRRRSFRGQHDCVACRSLFQPTGRQLRNRCCREIPSRRIGAAAPARPGGTVTGRSGSRTCCPTRHRHRRHGRTREHQRECRRRTHDCRSSVGGERLSRRRSLRSSRAAVPT